jgi:PilZ domain
MENISERRLSRRYKIRIALRFRVAEDGPASKWRVGRTSDMSNSGVSFQCRHPLPPDAHIEMVIDWPSKQGGIHPIFLRAAGHVVRSCDGEVAVRMTSSRLVIEKAATVASDSTL